MKPPAAQPADDPGIPPPVEPLVALLELTASYRPDLLPWLLSFLPQSPAGYMLEHLAGEWEVRPGDVHPAATSPSPKDRGSTSSGS